MTRLLVILLLAARCGGGELGGAEQRASKASLPAPRVVAEKLEVPWAIAFAPDGRILFTERPGRVRVIAGGKLVTKPLYVVPGLTHRAEIGLMGLALHPDFAKNALLYLAYGTERGGQTVVDVVRYREANGTLVEATPIVRNIPGARYHSGCRLKFGPDRRLYVTTGDATEKKIAQDPRSLGGKILRLNDDGSIPADNPWPGSPVWTLGHRNPQGIAWDPDGGLLWSTEHGPSGFDGGFGGDEVNLIERGKNYGWPTIHHDQQRPGLVSPVIEHTPAHAPASAAFWRGDLYFGCLKGAHLHRIRIDKRDRRKAVSQEVLFEDSELGRIREVAVGPDGALYFSTSNRDGRGYPAETDDRIFVVRWDE